MNFLNKYTRLAPLVLQLVLGFLAFQCKGGSQKGNWSAEDKTAFMDSCLKQSEPIFAFYRDVVGIEADTKSYCNCFLTKAEGKYESRTDAESAKGPEVAELASGCKDALVSPEAAAKAQAAQLKDKPGGQDSTKKGQK